MTRKNTYKTPKSYHNKSVKVISVNTALQLSAGTAATSGWWISIDPTRFERAEARKIRGLLNAHRNLKF